MHKITMTKMLRIAKLRKNYNSLHRCALSFIAATQKVFSRQHISDLVSLFGGRESEKIDGD